MKHHSCRDAGCGGVHLNQMALVPKGKKRKIWDFSQDSASIGNKYAHILEQRLFGNTLYYGHTYNHGVLFVKKRNRLRERQEESISIGTSSSLAQLQPR